MSENASLRHLRSQAEAFFGLAMDPKFFGRVKLTLNFDSTLAQGATAILKSVPLNPASKGNMESSSSTRRRKRRKKSKNNKKKNDDKAAASESQPAAAAATVVQQSPRPPPPTPPQSEAGVLVEPALTYAAEVDRPSDGAAAGQNKNEASQPIRAAQAKHVENPDLAQTPSCRQVPEGVKTPPQKVVPVTAEVSNDAPVQPTESQMRSVMFWKQLNEHSDGRICRHFVGAPFTTPIGDFRCIDVKQCILKAQSYKDKSLLVKLANKERELRAKHNLLYDNEESDFFCDSDNEFTTVTKKRKRRFNWSSEKKESQTKEPRLRDSPDASVKKQLFKK